MSVSTGIPTNNVKCKFKCHRTAGVARVNKVLGVEAAPVNVFAPPLTGQARIEMQCLLQPAPA